MVIIDYISDIITSLQCIIIPEQTECDLASHNKLITGLITLRLILKDTEKTEKVFKLKIKNELKKLEQEKINELKLLEEEIFFMTLRNKHLGRSSHITKEEEVELREQAKKKINQIKELEKGVHGIEFQIAIKILEDLNFLKHEEIEGIAKVELELIRSGISKELTSFFKKPIIPKKHLHLVSEEQLKKYIMLNY